MQKSLQGQSSHELSAGSSKVLKCVGTYAEDAFTTLLEAADIGYLASGTFRLKGTFPLFTEVQPEQKWKLTVMPTYI